jgi:hypothetical protein
VHSLPLLLANQYYIINNIFNIMNSDLYLIKTNYYINFINN